MICVDITHCLSAIPEPTSGRQCGTINGKVRRFNVRFQVLAQPVDATQALNLSAGVSNVKVLRGRSLS